MPDVTSNDAEEDRAAIELELELAADKAILACGGDVREAVKALIVANGFLEDQLAAVSYGYARGRVRPRETG